jgi:hypothetical protein
MYRFISILGGMTSCHGYSYTSDIHTKQEWYWTSLSKTSWFVGGEQINYLPMTTADLRAMPTTHDIVREPSSVIVLSFSYIKASFYLS